MTLKRYIIVRPDGTLYRGFNHNVEMYFKDRSKAEKVAVSWGTVREVVIEVKETPSPFLDRTRIDSMERQKEVA